MRRHNPHNPRNLPLWLVSESVEKPKSGAGGDCKFQSNTGKAAAVSER